MVATSTVGVAATGLVFGRPQLSTPARPASNKRKATEYDMEQQVVSSPRSRPATSSTLATPIREATSSPLYASTGSGPRIPTDRTSPNEDSTSPVLRLNSTSRRRDILSSQDHGVGSRRDSLSSRNSWIRRLSTIQVSSHQGSPRSSTGPDSPSLTFSHGSAAPILDTAGSSAPLPPNKLVKRTTSGRLRDGDTPVRNGSRSQVPTLRRPATSHQRSVTLQQQLRRDRIDSPEVSPQQHSSPSQTQQRVIVGNFPPPDSRTPWRLYFESRPTKLNKERQSARPSDSSMDAFYSTTRRIILPEGSTTPYLLKATMIIESEDKTIPSWMETLPAQIGEPMASTNLESPPTAQAADEEPRKLPRRSLSMNFTSPSTWITRSGSLRATKRGTAAKPTGKRYSSAPIAPLPVRAATSAHGTYGSRRKGILDPNVYQNNGQESGDGRESQSPSVTSDIQTRTRNNSSPLPPLSRLSSFNMDLTRLGLSSSSSSAPRRSPISPNSPINHTSPVSMNANDRPQVKSSPKVIIHQDTSPRIPEAMGSDRASTLIGSDSENRGFASGEEDEIDFQSDTVFDSYRTGTTGSIRVRNPPLELMFDDSPPNNGHKIKTTIIRDLAANGAFRESIVEEDEDMVTPIKHRRGSDKDRFSTPSTPVRDGAEAVPDDIMQSSPPSFSLGSKEFARLSLEDDDEEEDWTKDDDSVTISNPLSPPSSSINSRRVSSAIRTALADVTKTGSSSGNAAPSGDRPRSLFDWSEPLTAEKVDVMGNSPRPKTVHGKRIIDGRGGRTVGRKGPNAIHIRSQSVPVVPDVAGHREHGKLAPKFGTWGLGGKGVNEDWDNDFEFDGADVDEKDNTNDSMSGSGMLVPEAIQASQANVVGHVGQIREVCWLVEDLKRLRGLAREKGILDGSSASLWREAEGIIALAIPDEEDETLSPPRSPSSYSFERESIGDRYRDGGFDVDELSEAKGSVQASNNQERATGLVYDGLHVRRQSVFSPEDDIFGAGGVAASQRLGEEQMQSMKAARQMRSKDSTDVARTVMEHIHQHRAASDPLRSETSDGLKKMPFDTTSLRDLVHRANTLSRALAEIIRKVDCSSQSPHRNPKNDLDSSPAFTRVFTDPHTSPPKNLLRSQSNNSILSGSIDASPTRGLGKRMHMMTVV